MPDILRTGLSGLLAFQRALTTTGNNVANANTPGYSRQRVELVARRPEGFGYGFVGTGVDVTTIRRIVDQFAINQSRTADASFGRFDTYATYAEQVDNILGDPNTGLASGLSGFFNAWQDVANDPASLSARQLLVGQAQAIADRFRSTAQRLDAIGNDVNARIGATVRDINQYATAIAKLNEDILNAGAGVGQPPNDLLDQRDQVLGELAKLTNITVLEEPDGALNVFIGNGQALVLRNQALGLDTAHNAADPTRIDVVYRGVGGNQIITDAMRAGGSLGGMLDVRAELLDTARNSLGQVATALAMSVNAQHREGMTLQGVLGADIFTLSPPQGLAASGNTGTGALAVSISDLGGLTADEYTLRFNGTYTLVRNSTGQAVTMTGTGTSGDPLRAEGLSIVVSGAPVAGDQFLIRPTRDAAASLRSTLTDPRAVAAAAPIRSASSSANTGNASIAAGEVLDAANAQLLTPVTIQFLTATTYSINGAGSFAYTSGGNIDVNGWRVQITGVPAVGDTFTMQSNVGGVGDNRNALQLGAVQSLGILSGGAQSIGEAFGSLVGNVGAQARQATLNRDAQEAIASYSREQMLEASGVNLDEEAADMLRWQQAYQAAAHTITVADEMFQTLMSVVRR